MDAIKRIRRYIQMHLQNVDSRADCLLWHYHERITITDLNAVMDEVEQLAANLTAAQSRIAEAEGELERLKDALENHCVPVEILQREHDAEVARLMVRVESGEAAAYMQGREENGIVGRVTTEQAILAAASEPAKVPEVCVWTKEEGFLKYRHTACGNKYQGYVDDFTHCPYCGKPLAVK